MALQPRQVSLYIHRIEIWRFSEPAAAAGRPQPKSWARIATAVPCYLEATESDFGLNAGMLLSEQDMIFTLDVLHCEVSVDLRVADIFKVVVGPRLGFWRVRGNDKPKARRANKQSFRAAILEAPPLGVS